MRELYERWKPIKGFEGLYEISNLGNVKTIGRKAKNGTFFPTKLLKLTPNKSGYIWVNLYKDGKAKSFFVHRLVAIHFIPNPNNYQIVNHLDRNPSNCRVDNLEWCTQSHNCRWDGALERRAKAQTNRKDVSKLVNQYTLDGVFIKTWPSMKEIERKLGADTTGISKCCKKKSNNSSYYGFQWRFLSDCNGTDSIEPYNNPKTKTVLQYTLDGEFVSEWPSLAEIQRTLNYQAGNICQHIKGQFKQAYGYIWRYAV